MTFIYQQIGTSQTSSASSCWMDPHHLSSMTQNKNRNYQDILGQQVFETDYDLVSAPIFSSAFWIYCVRTAAKYQQLFSMGLNISAQLLYKNVNWNLTFDHRFFPRSGDFIKFAQPMKTPLGDGGWLKGTAETGIWKHGGIQSAHLYYVQKQGRRHQVEFELKSKAQICLVG